MMAGHINGSGRPPEDGKVASLADARKRAAAKAKQEKRVERAARRGEMSPRDWVIGAAFIAMALGMLWYWVAPLVKGAGVAR